MSKNFKGHYILSAISLQDHIKEITDNETE